MASTTTTTTLSAAITQSGRDQAHPVTTRLPSNGFQDGQPVHETLARDPAIHHPVTSQSQVDSDEVADDSIGTSYQDPTHLSTDLGSYDYRTGLQSRRSSNSLASSLNTVIHLGSSTIVDPTPTPQLVHGSILESGSHSSQLLSQMVAKSTPNTDPPHIVDIKSSKIQFHNIVRISGGITSTPKRKRASKQTPTNISCDRHRPLSIDPHRSNTSRSPPGRPNLGNISNPSYPHPINSPNQASPDFRSTRPGEISRFDTSDSSSSSVNRSFHINKQSTLRPGPPSSTRSTFSRQSRTGSTSPSDTHNQLGRPGSHHPTLTFSLPRRASMSSSVTGSANYASTIISRSSSPASSLYLPLRVPVARAPAPFFGPTPERIARVRERRQVAQRDAERAKGGWKAWWNNWYYQSDRFATRKGKGKQDSTSASYLDHHPHSHSHSHEGSDSDDGSCYHDVILEHERKNLERKLSRLRRLKQIRSSTDRNSGRPASLVHQGKKKKPNPDQASSSKSPESWLSWASSIIVGLPPSPVHPLLTATPGSGILRRPSLVTTPLIAGKAVVALNSERSSYSTPSCYVTVPEADSRTPLLSRPLTVSSYGDLPPQPSPTEPTQPSPNHVKTPIDLRFGTAPRRWFTFEWWAWKGQTICLACYLKLKSKLVGLFHIDWDSDHRNYEGWENV